MVCYGRYRHRGNQEAADIIITDDNFASIVAAVEEGVAFMITLLKLWPICWVAVPVTHRDAGRSSAGLAAPFCPCIFCGSTW